MQETPSLIPGLGRSLGKGKATHSSILAWRIPWIKVHGVAKELDMTERLSLHYKGREPHFVHHCLSGTCHTTYLRCNTYFLFLKKWMGWINSELLSKPFSFFFYYYFLFVVNFVIHWNEKALGSHVFPIPIPPPQSPFLSTTSPSFPWHTEKMKLLVHSHRNHAGSRLELSS